MNLTNLPADTKRRLDWRAISDFVGNKGRFRLIQMGSVIKYGRGAWIPTTEGKTANGRVATYLLHTFTSGKDPKLKKLNGYLKGNSGNPYVEALIGTIPVVGTAYGVSQAAINILAQTHYDVLGRIYDKVVGLERIGKDGNQTMHMAQFFILDPHRKKSGYSTWLIHEERTKVVIPKSK